jgi:FkbM family methyltransferase
VVDFEPAYGKKWIIDKQFGRAYFKGYYEPALTNFFKQNFTNKSVFIDIGSHAGYFSLLASSVMKNGKVISFEPVPYNFRFIERIRKLNKLENEWTVINKAVGSSNGKSRFDLGDSSSTGHMSEDGTVEVEVIKLDDVLRSNKLDQIDFMKIDVEGFGGEVLKGGLDTILKYRPTIIFETHRNTPEQQLIFQLLGEQYNAFDLFTGEQLHSHNPGTCEFLLLKSKSGNQ